MIEVPDTPEYPSRMDSLKVYLSVGFIGVIASDAVNYFMNDTPPLRTSRTIFRGLIDLALY
jgi:hypothetical protein